MHRVARKSKPCMHRPIEFVILNQIKSNLLKVGRPIYSTLHPFMVGKWVPTSAGKVFKALSSLATIVAEFGDNSPKSATIIVASVDRALGAFDLFVWPWCLTFLHSSVALRCVSDNGGISILHFYCRYAIERILKIEQSYLMQLWWLTSVFGPPDRRIRLATCAWWSSSLSGMTSLAHADDRQTDRQLMLYAYRMI